MTNIFVSGIGTGIGKTIVSAVLCEALVADYWKPIQAGGLDHTDSHIIKELISNDLTTVHSENFRLTSACSPHLAAKLDNISIEVKNFTLPKTERALIIEGAGGLMVPLNGKELVIDLISHLNTAVILVSQNYLGSINHSLLSIEALRARAIPVIGIVFNGPSNRETEEIITSFSKVPIVGRVFEEKLIDKEIIRKYAADFQRSLSEFS